MLSVSFAPALKLNDRAGLAERRALRKRVCLSVAASVSVPLQRLPFAPRQTSTTLILPFTSGSRRCEIRMVAGLLGGGGFTGGGVGGCGPAPVVNVLSSPVLEPSWLLTIRR